MAGAAGFLGTEEFVQGRPQLNFNPTGKDASNDDAAKARADRPQPATLVTIFLRGGADMLNAIVPWGDDLYYKYRPKIGIRPTGKGAEEGVAKLGNSNYWGLNPRMADLVPMLKKGTLIPILNVGSPDGTRSHFSAQDNMERGCTTGQSMARGWLNRYLELTKKPYDAPLRGLSAQTLVPRALRGNYPVLAGNNHTEQMDLFEKLYSSQNMVNMTERNGAGDEHGTRLDDINVGQQKAALTSDMTRDIITMSGANAVDRIKALEIAEATPNDADYPNGGLANQLATIARVIKANVGLEVAQADFGGWDVHSAAGGPTGGRMAELTQHLTECLVAFSQDLGKRMDKVMVLVMTEFGRTVEENGALGLDHGRGGWMLAMGNMLNGGNFYGKWNGMADTNGGRFLPVHTDFRSVYAESLYKLFGFNYSQTDIFPGYKGSPTDYLNFMQSLKQA